MKIIKLTEQELKNIINKVINEQGNYDVTEDPKALALVNFLNDTETDRDYGLIDIKHDDYDGGRYKVIDKPYNREYVVYIDEEADNAYKDYMHNLIDDLGIDAFNQYFIMNYVQPEWFEEALKEMEESYISDIRHEKSSDPDKWENRLEEEMSEYNVETENEFLERLIDNAGDPIEYYKSNFGDKDFNNIVENNNLIDWDEVIEAAESQDGRGSMASYDGQENISDEYYIYRLN